MNQTPFRTLLLWTVWSSATLVIYLALYSGTDLLSFLKNDPSKITWLIIVMFLGGLLASFVLTMLITFEALYSAKLERIARQGGLHAIEIETNKRATGRFFKSLKSTVEHNGQAEVETLLHIELAALERISHTIELIGNLLVTLGLIGTVMGLTLTLTGLTGSLEALGHNQELLLSGLRQAMAGMGTAFYTTLLGAILGGVLLKVFAQITQHGVENLHDNILRICLVYCSADYRPTLERDVRHLNTELQRLDEMMHDLNRLFDDSRQAVNLLRSDIRQLGGDSSRDDEATLETLIKQHQAYCQILREEMTLLYNLKQPWWLRLKALFRS